VKLPRLSPGRWLLVGGLVCALVALVTAYATTRTPWLGLELRSDSPQNAVRVISARGPAHDVPVPSTLVAVAGAGGATLALEATDLIDEPDFFDRYAEMERFFGRQSQLAAALASGSVTLTVRSEAGETRTFEVKPLPSRPIGTLPRVFWFQLVAGCVGALVALWVLALRPGVDGVRMFALTGVMLLAFTAPASIYSTRELALDGRLMRALSSANHLNANVFGIGLLGLFLMFPRPLVRPRLLWLLPVIFVGWWVLDTTHLAPDQTTGARIPIMAEMLLAIVVAIVQWRKAKGDPRARASLRWFGVSVLGGAGLFVFSVVGTSVLGMFPPIEQGYSFGFFLLMHVGLALGLRRTRLFELNELSYLVLVAVLGVLALIGVDAAVLLLLDTSKVVSSGVALLVVGFAYLPVRSWLLEKALTRRKVDEHELFRRILDVVFALEPEDRSRRWVALFETLFSPLEIERRASGVASVAVRDEGLALDVPAITSLPALRLSYPWRGRGLFGLRHAQLVTALLQLAEHAENARDAFDRGAREERARVARDLHDDVGAALTSGLYQEDAAGMRQAIESAILEMRSMVNVLTGRRLRLSDVVGDLRHESFQRLAAAKIVPHWPLAEVGDRTIHSSVARNYASMMRELTSNVIRHSKAASMTVSIELAGDRLITVVEDDGVGFDGQAPAASAVATAGGGGNGVGNLRRRAREVGATLTFRLRDRGTSVRLDAPLDPAPGADAPGASEHGPAESVT